MFSSNRIAIVVSWFAAGLAFAQEPALQDPMKPFQESSSSRVEGSAPRRIRLTAVLVSTTRRVAVINGDLYREGDEINGAKITRIESGSVRLRRGSEDSVVYLNTERTRTSENFGDPAS